jgi:predicted CXXCH cytochrome family protein
VLLTAPAGQALAQVDAASSVCIECHASLDTESLAAPARSWPDDVHAVAGFGCVACHGGEASSAEAPHDPQAGFLAAPARAQIPRLCGRCHADAAFMRDYDPGLRVDQVAEYVTSVHGRLLLENDDPDVATCISCHPAHDIRPPEDLDSSVHPLHVAELCGACHADQELMQRRGHAADQLRDYRESVHARLLYEEGDLSAPTCNDCHGNHGAAPPGLASVRNVCGQCHATMADYFAASGHVEPFDIDARPGCVTCHGNHDVQEADEEALTTRSEGVCDACHGDPTDPYGREFRVMRSFIDSLEVGRDRAGALLEEAENRGMEVSEALFTLEEVNNALTMARAAVHSFHVAPVAEALEPGFETVGAAWERALDALAEHRFRRAGLAVSFVVILALITSLVLKIRNMEAPRRAPDSDDPSPPRGENR